MSARVDAYWEANIDLTDFVPGLDLYDQNWPIWTYGEIVPPSKFIHDETGRRGQAISSMISGGCIVSGTEVRQSLLFTGVHAHSYGTIEQAVLLPYVQVGRHARLTAGHGGPRRGDPRRPGGRRGPRRRRRAASAARRAASA